MHIILCVTNDVVTDRRVNRTALTLMKKGHRVTVIGRTVKAVTFTGIFPFKLVRMRLLFRKGPCFYAGYNIRLFFYLIFAKADMIVANDLDTLPAAFLSSRIKKNVLLYDSHEYFTEVPELIDRPLIKRIWQGMEGFILPRLKYAYTVSDSIARAYQHKYGLSMHVIRNLPERIDVKSMPAVRRIKTGDQKIILYQGWLNKGRGLELAIRAMEHVPEAKLILVGSGDVEKDLKALVARLALENNVWFAGRISAEELASYTLQADLGISLERDLGLNYRFALPNKLFDYIQAEVPVVVSDLPEMAAVVRQYGVGIVSDTEDPKELARLFHDGLNDDAKRRQWKTNLKNAAEVLCWEKEEHKLLELYQKAIGNG